MPAVGGRREIAGIVTAGAVAAGLVVLDRRSGAADEQTAIAVARGLRGPVGRGLDDVIAAGHGGGAVAWSARRESACFSHVRVDARGADAADVAFVVDLDQPSIHPANALGEDAIRGLGVAP